MISNENFGWICPDDFVQIYAPEFGLKVERWLHIMPDNLPKVIIKHDLETSIIWDAPFASGFQGRNFKF